MKTANNTLLKTKVITPTNHKKRKQQRQRTNQNSKQIHVTGFGFASHWLRKWREVW